MRLILIISIIFLTFVNSSFAASGTGDAAVFKVTMKKWSYVLDTKVETFIT